MNDPLPYTPLTAFPAERDDPDELFTIHTETGHLIWRYNLNKDWYFL